MKLGRLWVMRVTMAMSVTVGNEGDNEGGLQHRHTTRLNLFILFIFTLFTVDLKLLIYTQKIFV